jgi:putative membrane protein
MKTALLHWLLASLILMVVSYAVPGIRVESFMAALWGSLTIGFINVLIWPLLVLVTLPLTIVTFGLFLFVINGFALMLAAAISPGFEIIGLWPAILGSLLLTILGWLVRFVFGAKQKKPYRIT